eukprot:4626579-Pleurochrysis_carterae.AAC.1
MHAAPPRKSCRSVEARSAPLRHLNHLLAENAAMAPTAPSAKPSSLTFPQNPPLSGIPSLPHSDLLFDLLDS